MLAAVPTFISGLPVHVLLVHAVVVLVPLAVLGTVTIAVWPAARQRHGWLVVALTAVAALVIPLTTSSGEGLRAHLPPDPLIAAHAHLGDELLPFAGLLLVAATALVVLDRYRARAAADTRSEGPGAMVVDQPGWTRPASLALSGLVLVLAVVTAVQVVRIGDSGARAAWSQVHYVQPLPGRHHGDDD
ncbi:MAG: DUF2231 domain-containing protein [Pseudonocardiaceae bacterium]